MKILIVENDYTGRLLLKEFLKHHGTPHYAGNGEEAVNAVKESLLIEVPFDLICMDVMMPGMNGFDAVEKIRALEENHAHALSSHSKIIMTTVLQENIMEKKHPLKLYNAYVVKPIKKRELDGALLDLGLIA